MRFFTTVDNNVWINKTDLLNYIEKLRKTKTLKQLMEEIEKCKRKDAT